MSQIVDARGLATKLRVTPATVLTWARRGWIPCLRAGRRPVLFDLAEVERTLRARATRRAVADADGPPLAPRRAFGPVPGPRDSLATGQAAPHRGGAGAANQPVRPPPATARFVRRHSRSCGRGPACTIPDRDNP